MSSLLGGGREGGGDRLEAERESGGEEEGEGEDEDGEEDWSGEANVDVLSSTATEYFRAIVK